MMVALLKQMHLQNDTGLYALYDTISNSAGTRGGGGGRRQMEAGREGGGGGGGASSIAAATCCRRVVTLDRQPAPEVNYPRVRRICNFVVQAVETSPRPRTLGIWTMLRLPRATLPARPLGLRSLLLRPQFRSYARPGPLTRRPRQHAPAEREVWVDPFKAPPPPRPDPRVLIKPAIFTVVVLLSADYIADHFLQQRTTTVTTRAERQRETQWTLVPIIATNLGVFLLWRVFPSFLHRIGAVLIPFAPTPAQLVVATFSHQEIWHLLFNQLALWMFGSVVCDTIGREHFLALYFKAACVSSLASISASQFLVKLGFWNTDHLTRGSLGASGIVYSFLGISAIIYPEMRVGLIFVPFVFFPLKYVFPCVLAFDSAGLALRWSTFDHVAHVWNLHRLLEGI